MTLTADLGPGSRAKALEAMQGGELDVLVVGAGVVGAGTALDAVSRLGEVLEADEWREHGARRALHSAM